MPIKIIKKILTGNKKSATKSENSDQVSKISIDSFYLALEKKLLFRTHFYLNPIHHF
jgi:hypothetical protein